MMRWLWSCLRSDGSLQYLVWLAAGVVIGSAAWATSQPETERPQTSLPLLADAVASRRTWLTDFDNDQITISADLYEVLLTYQYYRHPAA